jgi:hypothetical protein
VAWARERTYRPSDRRLSEKLVPTFADTGCHVVSVTDSYCRILGFLDRSRYFLFQVAPQLYSRGWVHPVPDPLLLRKSGKAENRTPTSGYVARTTRLQSNTHKFIQPYPYFQPSRSANSTCLHFAAGHLWEFTLTAGIWTDSVISQLVIIYRMLPYSREKFRRLYCRLLLHFL